MVFTSCLTVVVKLPQSGLEIVPNCPKVVPKLSQSCLKVVPKLTGRIGWLRMGAWYPLPAYLLIHRCNGWSGHMQTHSDTIGKWTNIIIIRNTNTKFADTKTDTHTNE